MPHVASFLTRSKSMVKKAFDLSGALLKDHNAGVREDIALYHRYARLAHLLHARHLLIHPLRSPAAHPSPADPSPLLCRILVDPATSAREKDRAERMLSELFRHGLKKTVFIFVFVLALILIVLKLMLPVVNMRGVRK